MRHGDSVGFQTGTLPSCCCTQSGFSKYGLFFCTITIWTLNTSAGVLPAMDSPNDTRRRINKKDEVRSSHLVMYRQVLTLTVASRPSAKRSSSSCSGKGVNAVQSTRPTSGAGVAHVSVVPQFSLALSQRSGPRQR